MKTGADMKMFENDALRHIGPETDIVRFTTEA